MSPFLHGVETIELSAGPRPIRGVKTGVIGLVGTAPLWQIAADDQKINVPTLILNDRDAAKYFGTPVAGYTIPQALKAIFDQSSAGRGAIVVVVNTFDPAVHKAAVAAADFVLPANDIITLPNQGVRAVVVKNQAGAVTYIENTDYTVDYVKGTVKRLAAGAIAALATLKINYDRPDPTLVLAANVIGVAGPPRTGLNALEDAQALFGFKPKILIAPSFSTAATVAAALDIRAGSMRAIALVDAPAGTTLAVALAGRGAGGAINFQSSSKRLGLCYPWVKALDPVTGVEGLEPLSQRLAGAMAARDLDESFGYWWSISNAELKGVLGLERALTCGINDPASEVNQLNEQGIITVFNAYGTGFRVWGNASAARPSISHPTIFLAVQRTVDVVHDSLEQSAAQFVDAPISDALLDSITESVNSFIRTLIGRGALIDGRCFYDPARNPAVEIAAGHLTFSVEFMPPTPAERITFETHINIELLKSIGSQAA